MSGFTKLYLGGALLLFGASLPEISCRGLPLSILDVTRKQTIEKEFFALVEKDIQSPVEDKNYLLRFISLEELNLLKRGIDSQDPNQKIYDAAEEQKLNSILGIVREAVQFQHEKERSSPYSETVKTGSSSPILYCRYGKFDMGSEVTTDELEKLARSDGPKMVEEADLKLRSMRKDVSRFNAIVNLEGYNVDRNGCLQCVQVGREPQPRDVDAQYHEINDFMLFFNAPSNLATTWPWLTQAFMKLDLVESMNLNVLGGQIGVTVEPLQDHKEAKSDGDTTKHFRSSENWITGVRY